MCAFDINFCPCINLSANHAHFWEKKTIENKTKQEKTWRMKQNTNKIAFDSSIKFMKLRGPIGTTISSYPWNIKLFFSDKFA